MAEAIEPSEYRPITVSSLLVRAFHKVLANRIVKYVPLNKWQRAFQALDGCAESTLLLDFMLRYHR